MKKKLAKLIDLKSIVTLVMVLALVIGWFRGMVTSEQFIPLVTMIITFYFAKTKLTSDREEVVRVEDEKQ